MNCLATSGTPIKALGVNACPTSPPPPPNQQQFQVGQLMTRTGFMNAPIYLARNTADNSIVVIKKYNVDKKDPRGEDTNSFIQHEVTSMKMLKHEHLLPCLNSLVVNLEIWLVSPLMGYGSVTGLIKQHFPEGLPELACCFVLRDTLTALRYLHQQGVVHRSVRCSHILINDLGDGVLTGFRYCTQLQSTGDNKSNLYDYPLHGIKSNLCWLAPEILKQNLLGYSETSDIYSLGVSACEMANGIVPYSDFPSTLMMIEKLRGSSPRLMDFNTLQAANIINQNEDEVGLAPGPLTLADSGVGDSVGSSNNMIGNNRNHSFYNRELSAAFHDFVNECTISNGDERQSATQLLNHPFIKQLKKTTANLLTLLHPIQPIVDIDKDECGLIVEQMQNLQMEETDNFAWSFE